MGDEFPSHPLTIDLPAEGQRVLEGGGAASAGGDINGDGRADVLIDGSSAVSVIFGPLGGTPVDPATPGDRGFVVQGRPSDTYYTPRAAGDVNGDGLEDIVIGAANPCDQVNTAFVVFGKHGSAPVDLTNLGDGGFRIDGSEAANSDTGYCIARRMIASGAGDFNTDGLADVVVADYGVDGVYVVFGKADNGPVVVDSLGTAGVSYDFPVPVSLDGGLDANGDGAADVVAGGFKGSPYEIPDFARVLFGGTDASIERGFSITGRKFIQNGRYQEVVPDLLGHSLAMIHDLNGDGLAEVALGAPNAPSLGYVPPPPDDMDGPVVETDFGGGVFVVFGRGTTATVDAYDLGDGGFRLGGDGDYSPGARGSFGGAVARAGDVNGDGLDDIAVVGGGKYPFQLGLGWVVFGKGNSTSQAVTAQSRATDVPSRYLEVAGSGSAVGAIAPVGDQTGDGRPDVLMGGTLVMGPPPALLSGACANEVPVVPGGSSVFTSFHATYATNAGDRIAGGIAGDRVEALLGNDCVSGAVGPDELDGGGGDDSLIGGKNGDNLDGGDGNDVLIGGRDDDNLAGGRGADRLAQGTLDGVRTSVVDGGPGADRIVGAGGPDILYGGPGRDRLLGRVRPDRLDGGPGRDVLIGGRAFDRIYSVDGFADVVRCGAHRDRAWVDSRDRTVGCERIKVLTPP